MKNFRDMREVYITSGSSEFSLGAAVVATSFNFGSSVRAEVGPVSAI